MSNFVILNGGNGNFNKSNSYKLTIYQVGCVCHIFTIAVKGTDFGKTIWISQALKLMTRLHFSSPSAELLRYSALWPKLCIVTKRSSTFEIPQLYTWLHNFVLNIEDTKIDYLLQNTTVECRAVDLLNLWTYTPLAVPKKSTLWQHNRL